MKKITPVVLFVYNRPWHTKQTIEALQKNELASESDLIIYSDGARNSNNLLKVKEVRDYIRTIDGFKKVTIIEQETNLGLALSIIRGVTKIVNEHGKIIVLEDDMVTSPYFLKFMNDALTFYENEDKVWHICGWSYPVNLTCKNDVYLHRVMECWGWATWKKNWHYYEKNTKKLIKDFSKDDIKRFNLDGTYNGWLQVTLNRYGYIDTWAIYWYATIFKKNGLCVNPVKSFVKNIGLDGSGQNCKDPSYRDNVILNNKRDMQFISDVYEDNDLIKQIKLYFKKVEKNIAVKIFNKLTRAIFKKNLIK
jgi:hypothetical protein